VHVSAEASTFRRLVVPAVVGFALVARIATAAALVARASSGPEPEDYVARFTEIASAEGRPYRDHAVEYPPVTLAAIELVGDPDPRATAVRLVWLSLGLDLLLAASLLWGWGTRAAAAYLLASVPMLGALYGTLDVLPAVLSVAAVALALRRRERAGGVALAAAVLAKLWPLILVPGLLVWGRRRAFVWAVAALAAGTVLWFAWAGTDALGQVATQRHSPGWESESSVGTLVRLVGGGPVRLVKDSPRVGVAPGWAKALLALAAVAGVGVLWWRAERRGVGDVGAPALACVALLLFLSPIYSYPYVVWLLPWAAIAFAEGRRDLALLALGVELVTTVAYALLHTGGAPGSTWVYLVLVVRNAMTGAIPLVYWLRPGEREAARGAPGARLAGAS
jgi:hypothetical protein